MSRQFDVERLEKRIPMTIAVQLAEYDRTYNVETAFTEDVSSRGASVSSIRQWRADEKLELVSLSGDFRALARVVYCRPQGESFVIGLEFLEPTGRWVVNTPVGSGKPLQG